MAQDRKANKNDKRERDLALQFRARGLRKSAATVLAEGAAAGRKPAKLALALADDLKQLAAEVRQRGSGRAKGAAKSKATQATTKAKATKATQKAGASKATPKAKATKGTAKAKAGKSSASAGKHARSQRGGAKASRSARGKRSGAAAR